MCVASSAGPAHGAPQLGDPRGACGRRHQRPSDGRDQQGDGKGHTGVRAEEGDVHGVGVLGDENHQQD
jgi:hypothetical protein